MIKIKNLKQILTVLLSMIILLFLNESKVKASLQSNPNTQYIKTNDAVNWIKEFRNMEKTGETMGLNEELNSEDLTATSESNGIDIHMIRTTEYGATAILSASGYGNPSKENAITTTTGNDTGVMINTGYWENTAGGIEGTEKFLEINRRYYDTYKLNGKTSARVGDALGDSTTKNPGCSKWHSAFYMDWFEEGYDFARGNSGIFSFRPAKRAAGNHYYAWSTYCRGVAVCGAGI